MKTNYKYTIPVFVFFFFVTQSFGQNGDHNQKVQQAPGKLSRIEKTPFHLPEDKQKLRPRNHQTYLYFGFQQMVYNIWRPNYSVSQKIDLKEIVFRYHSGFEAPHLFQFRLGAEIKPWIKAGFLTHQRAPLDVKGIIYIENPRTYGAGNMEINFARNWGIYVEYTPFPVKYLRMRRYEVNMGGALMRENIAIRSEISGNYKVSVNTWSRYGNVANKETITPSVSVYGGFSVFLLPWLSVQSQIGFYSIPKIAPDPLMIDLPEPHSDFQINYDVLNLSWHYYSLGLNVNL
ncbi:MAG: hypothetical protein R3B93_13160 [Bacteroidia bacterium]